MEEIVPETSQNTDRGLGRVSNVLLAPAVGDGIHTSEVRMSMDDSEPPAERKEEEPTPSCKAEAVVAPAEGKDVDRCEHCKNDLKGDNRTFTRALNRVCVSDQIGRQESIMKSSFLSSVASLGSAINVWTKYSTKDATSDKPELTILIILLIVKTVFAFQLLLVQLYDIGRLKMYALLSVS